MRQIGNYTVEDTPIGSGGMGHVFRGTSANGGIPVAIKEILPQFVADIEFRSRIENEINFLKSLNNEHVVKIYDHFELKGNLYIVMELVEGLNVEQIVMQYGPIPWQDAVNYMLQLLNAMQDVHEHQIVHRDIKPSNIMIRPDGKLCLLDFGVAKDVSATATGRTMLGTAIGTDGYMSPEQAQGYTIDCRSDVYSLGCVLYYMITGTHAFANFANDVEMLIAISKGNFPRLAEKTPNVHPALQGVLDRATEANMMRRFQSCREFSTELSRQVLGGTISEPVEGPVSITIGRENCDVIVGKDNLKVSRHHGDITLREFTGGQFFVYTDCSSNGTTINGTKIGKGMTYNIPVGENPTILLAGEASCQVNIADIRAALEQKKAVIKEPQIPGGGSSNGFVAIPPENMDIPGGAMGPEIPMNPNQGSSMGFFQAIGACFSKYATFSGRASRPEYWWFCLFNFIINAILNTFMFLAVENNATEFITIIQVLSSIYFVGTLLPGLAVTVRRLHDIGKSGANILWAFLPIVGAIYLLILLVRASEPAINKYGAPNGFVPVDFVPQPPMQ